jgi:hypothetical protein
VHIAMPHVLSVDQDDDLKNLPNKKYYRELKLTNL